MCNGRWQGRKGGKPDVAEGRGERRAAMSNDQHAQLTAVVKREIESSRSRAASVLAETGSPDAARRLRGSVPFFAATHATTQLKRSS